MFYTTGTHTVKARLANTVLVAGTVKRAHDADLGDILVPDVPSEIRSFKLPDVDVHAPCRLERATYTGRQQVVIKVKAEMVQHVIVLASAEQLEPTKSVLAAASIVSTFVLHIR